MPRSRRCSPLSGEFEADESYFGATRVKGKRGRGAGSKKIVFGLLKRDATKAMKSAKNPAAVDIMNYQNNPELLRKLRSDFARNHKATMRDINSAIKSGDIKTAHHLSHTLKGLGGLIHESKLSAAAKCREAKSYLRLQASLHEWLRISANLKL